MVKRELLTKEELETLLTADLASIRKANTNWFWIRSTIGMAYISAMLIALIFFPERVFAKFNLPDQSKHVIFESYVYARISTLVVAPVIYFTSYLKQWYFPYVALTAFLVSIANFVNDYYTIYVYTLPDSYNAVYVVTACRILIITFLFINFKFSLKQDLRVR
jgi:hypothetical protein